jgi:hypothetical protein
MTEHHKTAGSHDFITYLHLVMEMDSPFNTMKQLKYFPLLLILALDFTGIQAQQNDSLQVGTSWADTYQAETIFLRFSHYEKNNQLYEIGIFGEGIKLEMAGSPDAMVFFKKYQRQKRWSLVCAGLQLATQIAAFTSNNKSRRTGLHIAGAGVSIVAVPLFIGSNINLNKAIWIRNGEVMKLQ